jgi:hypothetical protein
MQQQIISFKGDQPQSWLSTSLLSQSVEGKAKEPREHLDYRNYVSEEKEAVSSKCNDGPTQYDESMYRTFLRGFRKLQEKVINKTIKAASDIREFLKTCSMENVTSTIASAVRPEVVIFLKSSRNSAF